MSELRTQLVGLGSSENGNGPCGSNNGGIYGSTYEQFTNAMVKHVSDQVTNALRTRGYYVIVPDDKVAHVITEVYKNHSPNVGDIYSRFIIDGLGQRDDMRMIADKSIEIIVSQISNEFDMQKQNQSFSVWNQVLGTQNPQGIRQHSPIKLNGKRRTNLFWMRY